MENSTKLLQRQASALAARRAGVVEADDAALADLPAASLWLHADDFTVAGNVSGFVLVVLVLVVVLVV